MIRAAPTILVAALATALQAGCSTSGTLGYYAQAVGGHLSILAAAQPVERWIDDPATPPALRERLELARRIRRFAASELHLPDNASYRRYADLRRGAAVWNVVAAPELSLALRTWCFPVLGCVGYRGYFDRENAEALGAELRSEGFDVAVYGVPAYSTLGWSNWLGGDPLLNTFIDWPEGELAGLVFHELAHQVAYADDDTTFNESFATAVGRLGVERWLARQAGPDARDAYERSERRRHEFRALVARYRARLAALYESGADDAEKRRGKAELIDSLRSEYRTLRDGAWGGYAGYERWFASVNNASFGVQAAYDELVPQFERLFEREGRDDARFYTEVARLAKLPRRERREALAASAGVAAARP